MRVGIVGMGVIGSAQAEMFKDHDLVTYDPLDDNVYPRHMMSKADLILVCVGTPERPDGRADLKYVAQAVDEELPGGVPVAIRSTVPPGTTDRLLSNRLYAHVPEFMGENVLHSWQTPADVPYMIIGGESVATLFFRQKFAQVFPGKIHTCSAREAELAKYVANLYWATRVTFVNEFSLICEHFGVDYERVREAWLNDPRMTAEYTQRAGYPAGFGGRCWPKDLAALIAASEDAGYAPEFLRAVSDANERFKA